MGVNQHDVSFLLAARRLGVSYEKTLTIGRQWLFATPAELIAGHRSAGVTLDRSTAERLVHEGEPFAESVFAHLGAQAVDSLDASSYEASTIVHDLNVPLPDRLHGRYSVVFDGGTLEHVFNFPQALKNCMQAVQVGGHFLTITPANSLLGHGFYQFSPELYFRALTHDNGYEIKTVLVRAAHNWARWRQVADPERVGARVASSGPWPTFLCVLARRTSDVEPFTQWPQQSDYVTVWGGGTVAMSPKLRTRVVARLPTSVRRTVEAVRAVTAVLGRETGPDHFTPVELRDLGR